jgi:predicted phage-related endonuclease
MNNFTYINQDTWLEDRNKGIGASDIPILCGASNFMTPYELWEIKTSKAQQKITDETQILLDAGHEQEPITLYRFLKNKVNDKFAKKILKYHYENKKIPEIEKTYLFTEFKYNDFMFAHPDMIYFDGHSYTNIEAKFIEHKGNEWDFDDLTENGIPFKVYLQVQFQMMCTGLNKTIVCANYHGSQHCEFPIKVNPDLFPKFIKICTDFWQLVEQKEPPQPNTFKDVQKLFPNKNFKSLLLPEDLEMETMFQKDKYNLLKQRIKKYEKEKDRIKTAVSTLMTNNNILQTANGEQIARIVSKEKEKIKKLSLIKKDHPRIYKYLQKNNMIESKMVDRFYF